MGCMKDEMASCKKTVPLHKLYLFISISNLGVAVSIPINCRLAPASHMPRGIWLSRPKEPSRPVVSDHQRCGLSSEPSGVHESPEPSGAGQESREKHQKLSSVCCWPVLGAGFWQRNCQEQKLTSAHHVGQFSALPVGFNPVAFLDVTCGCFFPIDMDTWIDFSKTVPCWPII